MYRCIFVHYISSVNSYAIVSNNFLNNRINNLNLDKLLLTAVSFLRCEENVFPANLLTPEGVWENILPIKYG